MSSRPLMAPSGCRIKGTLETVRGVAVVNPDTLVRNAEGEVSYQHSGSTEMWWDEMKTVERDGVTVFVDEDGEEWLEGELVETPEEES